MRSNIGMHFNPSSSPSFSTPIAIAASTGLLLPYTQQLCRLWRLVLLLRRREKFGKGISSPSLPYSDTAPATISAFVVATRTAAADEHRLISLFLSLPYINITIIFIISSHTSLSVLQIPAESPPSFAPTSSRGAVEPVSDSGSHYLSEPRILTE